MSTWSAVFPQSSSVKVARPLTSVGWLYQPFRRPVGCCWSSRCNRHQGPLLAARPPAASAAVGSTDRHGEQQQPQLQEQPPTEQPRLFQSALQLKQRLSECPVCGGTGRVTCKDCAGQGCLPRGGYSKKNPLNMSRAVGSKWTAMVNTLGWRHFRVIAVRKLDNQKHNTYLLLQASCDSTAQLWVNALVLRNRSCWAAGWLQMSELQEEGVSSTEHKHKCHSCAGLGFKACCACDGRGRADLVQVL